MPGAAESALLVGCGFVAGFVNTLAGGGSFLTVPLLIMLGLPPTVANATNRVGVLVQNLAAVTGFRQEGVPGIGFALRLLPPTLLGSWLGAWLAASVPDEVFGRAFGVVMLLALPVILRNPRPAGAPGAPARRVNPVLEVGLYFGIGFYGGAIQAGIGIVLLLALVGAGGLDLVRGNSVKNALIAALSAVALAQFAWLGKVWWVHGGVLAVGTGLGGYAASRFGARVGDRLIRPVLTLAVVVLALRLLLAPLG